MIRKLSVILTILAALGLVIALAGCGKKGALLPPPAEAPAAATPGGDGAARAA
jgi:predicted small lipoprotein YifL